MVVPRCKDLRSIKMGKRASLLMALPLCFATTANAGLEDFCLPSFYIGADAELRHLPLKENYGDNLYHKQYAQGNFFIGLKGNDYIGVEAGFEATSPRKHTTTVQNGDILFGIPIPGNGSVVTRARLRNFYTSLMGFIPIFDCDNLSWIVGIGLSNIKIRLENIGISGNKRNPLDLTQSKSVIRLVTGVQYLFAKHFGIRATFRYENTAKFSNIQPLRSITAARAKANDSFICGVGIFFNW